MDYVTISRMGVYTRAMINQTGHVGTRYWLTINNNIWMRPDGSVFVRMVKLIFTHFNSNIPFAPASEYENNIKKKKKKRRFSLTFILNPPGSSLLHSPIVNALVYNSSINDICLYP